MTDAELVAEAEARNARTERAMTTIPPAVAAAIRAGIHNRLADNDIPDAPRLAHLLTGDAIRSALAAGYAFHADTTETPTPTIPADVDPVPPAADEAPEVGPRRRTVLAQVAAGHTNRAIAGRLYLAEDTVKAHVSWLLQAFGVRSRRELGPRALALGVITAADVAAAEPGP